ncbi:MAG TPA: MFS transporter [Steroidobacteraceae bacterium]|jgi:MFS family permease|nr:MFS transporter [Steroidobacteraceae bacterium]
MKAMGDGQALQRQIASRVRARLILPCIFFMLMSSLDRANLSFAAARMNADLGFSPSQYGFGAGVLFVGFLAGQYPSVWLFQRFGMRRWLAGCALLWGCCAAAMAWIDSPQQFYVLRVLLGFAEGGLAPGIVLYLSQFATERERATTFALPMLAIPLSIVIGGPLSGWLLGMDPAPALSGWRWMFLAEAVPTVLLGIAALAWFPDSPAEARWLAPAQRDWLAEHAARRARPGANPAVTDWRSLREPLVWLSGLLWFCLLSGAYGLIFWLPQVVASLTDLNPLQIGFVGALPWVGVALGMAFNSAHSDRTGERYWHVALPALLAAFALLAAWLQGPGFVALVALLLVGLGLGSAQGAFWALPTALLQPAALTVSVVTINIAGSAGGLVMPHLMGYARERSGDYAAPTLLVVAVLLFAAFLVAVISRIPGAPAVHRSPESASAPPAR